MTKSGNLSKNEERIVYAMQLLGDKTRFKIFKLMTTNPEMCVSEIATQLDITVSAVSQHFRSFELVGLVNKQRMGRKICYTLKTDDQLVNQLLALH